MTNRPNYFLVTCILLLAAFLRFYRLNELPPGLHYDEAFNAVQAQHVLSGEERPIYFTGDLTEEPMAIYAAAFFFWLFGASPFALRLVSAFAGLITVAAVYCLASTISKVSQSSSGAAKRSNGFAPLGALILAILYWHINFSRLGMELIFLPLMQSLAMIFLLRGFFLSKIHRMPLALAGLFLALTQYTYKAALFTPIFVGVFLLIEFLLSREFMSRSWRGLGVFLAVTVLAFAPLGLYWSSHPSEFLERPSTVLIAPTMYLENALRVGAMFFVQGDANPRSNLPGRPALDPFLALGFIVGLVACLTRIKRIESRLLFLWLCVSVLPSVLSDFAPHFGRSIGATPAIALIAALGFVELYPRITRFVASLFASPKFMVGSVGALYILFFAFSTFSTFRDYFMVWAADPGRFDSFDVGLLSLAQKLRLLPLDEKLFVTPIEREHYTIQFGLQGADATSFDGARAMVLSEPGLVSAYGIVTRSDSRSLPRLQKLYANGRVVDRIADYFGQPYAAIFQAEGAAEWSPQKRVDARLGDGVAFVGYDVARRENSIALTVYWKCLAPVREDETVFIHLLDSADRVVAQDDAKPGHGSFATTHWQVGQVIADDYVLSLPPASSGVFQVEIGMYVLETSARARVTDSNGVHMESDRVLVERFTFP